MKKHQADVQRSRDELKAVRADDRVVVVYKIVEAIAVVCSGFMKLCIRCVRPIST